MRRGITAGLIILLTFIVVLCVSISTAERTPVTRDYFENLDKESSLEDIVKDIGQYAAKEYTKENIRRPDQTPVTPQKPRALTWMKPPEK